MAATEKVNINTIARLAEVSTTTVSNFINCTESLPISSEKKRRILEAMQKHNYRPNSSSSMIRRKKLLPGKGVFIYGNHVACPVFEIIPNPMVRQLLQYLSGALMKHFGLALEVRALMNETSIDEWNEILVDAEFVINYGRLNPYLYKLAARKNIPFIVISEEDSISRNLNWDEEPEADFVYWDNCEHAKLLMGLLRNKGARRTFYISSWNVAVNHKDFFAIEAENKIAGYREYLAAHPEMSGEVIIPPIPPIIDMYYEIRNTAALLESRPEILENADAILAHNDIVARGVIATMTKQGLTPGKDIMVTGEGDFREFRHDIPAVTTVTYDHEALTREVCGLLKMKMSSCCYYGKKILIPSHVIERQTT